MKDYKQLINDYDSIEEGIKLLEEIRKDTKNNLISLKESKLLFKSIVQKAQMEDFNNILEVLNEQLIANTDAYKLRIDAVDESDFNQGPDTSYFKVYRQSRRSIHEPCLRISIYNPSYILTHKNNLIPLSKDEAKEVDDTLLKLYKRPTNNDAEKHYFSMLYILNPWLQNFIEKNKEKYNTLDKILTIPNLKLPTNWNAVIYYFLYINKLFGKTNISIEMKKSDYTNLPKKL